MPQISLANLSILLGLGYLLPQIYGLIRPADFGNQLQKFPRSTAWGVCLVALATLWFLSVVNQTQKEVSDFAAFKNAMFLGFSCLGIAVCIYLRDFLAVRGYAVLLLLLAKLMVETARWHDSQWRLVIITWAYLWVLGGVWFTISPWRVRDIIRWKTANLFRLRLLCSLRSAFALLLISLGLFVF